MTERKNIKLPEPLFERLKEDKGKHRSWPRYFKDLLAENDTGEIDTDELVADLKAQLPAAVAEEVVSRLR